MQTSLAGPFCHYCRAPAHTLDHIVPKALGGTNARVNLIPACFSCNQKKADHWPDPEHRGDGFTCGVCTAAVRYFRRLEARRVGLTDEVAERQRANAKAKRENIEKQQAEHAAAVRRKALEQLERRRGMTVPVSETADRDTVFNLKRMSDENADAASEFFKQLRKQNALADGPYHHGVS